MDKIQAIIEGSDIEMPLVGPAPVLVTLFTEVPNDPFVVGAFTHYDRRHDILRKRIFDLVIRIVVVDAQIL